MIAPAELPLGCICPAMSVDAVAENDETGILSDLEAADELRSDIQKVKWENALLSLRFGV
jgi:hypothetical protein